MTQYMFPCGCYMIEQGSKTVTHRCDEHKAKYPHRLDKEPKK